MGQCDCTFVDSPQLDSFWCLPEIMQDTCLWIWGKRLMMHWLNSWHIFLLHAFSQLARHLRCNLITSYIEEKGWWLEKWTEESGECIQNLSMIFLQHLHWLSSTLQRVESFQLIFTMWHSGLIVFCLTRQSAHQAWNYCVAIEGVVEDTVRVVENDEGQIFEKLAAHNVNELPQESISPPSTSIVLSGYIHQYHITIILVQ